MPSKQSLRVCVYNYKGGAAKTTIVVNTAAALAHPKHGNKKTLLIDLDPQCNSTRALNAFSSLLLKFCRPHNASQSCPISP